MASKLISHIAGLVSLKTYLTKRLLQAIVIPNINMNSDTVINSRATPFTVVEILLKFYKM